MADISSIKMPNGSIYDLKDKNAQTKINVSGILEGDGQGGISESDILDYDTDTTSGSVVSFTADGVAPLKSLTLSIDPVQDLHGYDSPWPAGGGKNKWHLYANGYYNSAGGFTPSGSNGCSDKIQVTVGATYVFGSTKATTETLTLRGYFFDENDAIVGSQIVGTSGSKSVSFTAPSGAVTVALWFSESGWMDTMTQTECDRLGMQMETGSSLTTFAPYSNLCPISGWDAVNLWRTGGNVFDPTDYLINADSNYNKSPGTTLVFGSSGASVSGTNPIEIAVTTDWRGVTFFTEPLKTGTTYHLRYRITAPTKGNIKRSLYWVDEDNKVVEKVSFSSGVDLDVDHVYHAEITPPTDGLRMAFVVVSSTQQTITIYDMGVMVGGWETYAPYSGSQFTIQLGQTVYGGTLDVTSGVLTVDRATAEYDGSNDETWLLMSSDKARYSFRGVLPSKKIATQSAITSMLTNSIPLKTSSETTSSDDGNLTCRGTSYESAVFYIFAPPSIIGTLEALRAYLASNPLQIIYPLATPLEYTLTSQQLDTLAGQNVLWADCGEVTVEYRKGENALLQDISEAIKNLQGKIRVSGLLKGDGNGNVTAAINGTDYSKVIIRDWSVT